MLTSFFHSRCSGRYRALAYVIVASLLSLLAFGWFYLRPRWLEVKTLQADVLQLEQEAKKGQWAQDPMLLQQHLNQSQTWMYGAKNGKEDDFRGIQKEEQRIQERATRYLKEKIVEIFPAIADENNWMTIENFMRQSSRIDFKYLANRLEADFTLEDLHLPEEIIQITEPSSEPVYQRILQLWVVEYIFSKLKDSQLVITNTKDGWANIQLLPPIGFTLDEGNAVPYLWEFPVKVTVRGTLQNFLRLQKLLVTRKYFFPIRNLSIHTRPPQRLPSKDDHLEINEQTMTLTVSSFFIPRPTEQRNAQPAATAEN